MKITICGSMSFAKEMIEYQEKLIKLGHDVVVPEASEKYLDGEVIKLEGEESAQRKIKYNFIKKHYDEIKGSDAILVVNYRKNGIENYIGANSFLEIAFAHVLGKKIYILNDLPKNEYIKAELLAMLPVVINNDLLKIKD